MTQYLKISINCSAKNKDLLIAELGLINYDSFQEFEDGIEAFINEDLFKEEQLTDILEKYTQTSSFNIEKLQNINWNEEWEKNFEPVYFDKKVQIRAEFHENKNNFIHDVIINPKMSFGTGHHETTHLVVSEQLSIDHENKRVLDVGTGTGILSIMAHKLGAKSILATDIDEWCIDNSHENFKLNGLENFEIFHGSIDNLTSANHFDIVLANINKNVLVSELPRYAQLLTDGGILILSGFYLEDVDDLKKVAETNMLKFDHSRTMNNWALLRLTK